MKKTKKTSYLKKTGRKTLKKKPKIVKTNYKIKRKLINVNGYNILLLDLPKAKLVQVECYILGSCLVEDKPGISHLLEHILTTAWKKCKPKTCDVFWEKYGAYSNATTYRFYKRYWINGLHKYLDTMVEYIFSIMLNPIIDNKTLKTERPASLRLSSCEITMVDDTSYNGVVYLNDMYPRIVQTIKHSKNQYQYFR